MKLRTDDGRDVFGSPSSEFGVLLPKERRDGSLRCLDIAIVCSKTNCGDSIVTCAMDAVDERRELTLLDRREDTEGPFVR